MFFWTDSAYIQAGEIWLQMGCFSVQYNRRKAMGFRQQSSRTEIDKSTTFPEQQGTDEVRIFRTVSAPGSFVSRVKSSPQSPRTSNSQLLPALADVGKYGEAINKESSKACFTNEVDILSSIGDASMSSTKKIKNKCTRRMPVQLENYMFSGQPLPLPTPESCGHQSSLQVHQSSFIFSNASTISCASPALPAYGEQTAKTAPNLNLKPLPESGPMASDLRSYSFSTLATACDNFSVERFIRDGGWGSVYRGHIEDETSTAVMDIIVVRLDGLVFQDQKEWIQEVVQMSAFQDSHLCKLLGYALDIEKERTLVYEHLAKGTLDKLLYGRSDGPPLDWQKRMKIALDAAYGLTYLHENAPTKVLFREFSAFNIQIDNEFHAKLMGYGFWRSKTGTNSDVLDNVYAAPETVENDQLSHKSNIWSFGILMLEILTGRQHMDETFSSAEKDLVKWSRSFLHDTDRLFLLFDPELKGLYPIRAAKLVAELTSECLQVNPGHRPSMRRIMEVLAFIQDEAISSRSRPLIDVLKENSLQTRYCKSPAHSKICTNSLIDSGRHR